MKQKKYHHGDLRRALLDASLTLLEEKGISALSLREVARRAGVTHAAPYRHFSDKDALLAAVAEEGFRKMYQKMNKMGGPDEKPVLERLKAIGVAYVFFAVENPGHFRVMFGRQLLSESNESSLQESASLTFNLLLQSVTTAQEEGLFKKDSPLEIAYTLWSLVHGLSYLAIEKQFWQLEEGEKALELMVKQATENLYRGLMTN